MGYKAKDQIDPLDYDFAPFADVQGKTPEFSVERIKVYWLGMVSMQRHYLDEMQRWEERRKALGDPPAQDAVDAFEAEYEPWSSKSVDDRHEIRRRLLAALCDDQPSFEELSELPSRVFDDFEAAMQEALTPKARSTAGM